MRRNIALNHSEPVPSTSDTLQTSCHHGAIPRRHVPIHSSVRLALLGSGLGFAQDSRSALGHGSHQYARTNQFYSTVSGLITNATHKVHQSPQVPQRWAWHNPPCVNIGLLTPHKGSVGGKEGLQRWKWSPVGGKGSWWAGGPGGVEMLGLGPSWEVQLSTSWIRSSR